MTDEQWQRRPRRHASTARFRMTARRLRHMTCAAPGRSSTTLGARLARAGGQAHYAAAKAGVMALTRCAAIEAAEQGVRVNAVAPSLAMHEFSRKGDASRAARRADRPRGVRTRRRALGDRERDRFLASDYSSYMTGEVVSVSSQHAVDMSRLSCRARRSHSSATAYDLQKRDCP
jgi:3-oxoacyl-[acyl-carrier protein] reductase